MTSKTAIHLMGAPYFYALFHLKQAFSHDFNPVVKTQIMRKVAKNPKFWRNINVQNVYSAILTFVEKLRLAKYLALFENLKPTSVVIWNGKKLPNQTVDIAAKLKGIDVFFFENGLIPHTTSLDPNGVNQAASLPKDPAFYIDLDNRSSFGLNLPDVVQRAPHKKRQINNHINLPNNYIFVPFQVPHDTQIVQYSPWIESMEALYTTVMTAVEKLNDKSLIVVFKEHPSWHKHYENLYQAHPKALFANNPTVDLINGARAVITINSTVGLEALQLDKKVITLGQACYNIEGLVQSATSVDELYTALSSLKDWQVNQDLKSGFFRYLKDVYSISGNWASPNAEHCLEVEQRLLGKDSFTKDLEKEFKQSVLNVA